MPAKPKHLHAMIAILFSLALLVASASVTPPMRGGAISVTSLAGTSPSDQIFKIHKVEIQPEMRRLNSTQGAHSKSAGMGLRPVRYACQNNIDPQPVLCYGPYQIRQAYGVTDLLDRQVTGRGTTIAIIDAYGSPTIRKDLQAFNAAWGLPETQLNIIAPFGIRGSDSTWISETSLDVEWAHAMAPGAAINLVLAKSSNDVDLYKTLAYAVKHNLGDVVSLSFGENEHCVDPQLRRAEHRTLREAASKGVTILAATGDYGSTQLTCDNSSYQRAVSYPASDPLVTAVGGTALMADAVTGRYIGETAWNESSAFSKATGGGYSKLYAAPSYQQGIRGTARGRGVPDIALNASVSGGVLVYENNRLTGRTKINIMGGTSVATPELAGILADGVQLAHRRLGSINPALYKLGNSTLYSQAMHDISSGDNMLASTGLAGYAAAPGWDPATGWGSPRHAETFLQALIAG